MKKIFTLASVLLITLVSFADYAPSRLIVSTMSNSNVRIVVDESKYSQQVSNSSIATFEGLTPGYHSVKVYEVIPQRGGFFGKRQTMRLLYTATVNVKPMYQLNIAVNRNGRAKIDEQMLRGRFDNKGWDDGRGRKNDRDDRYDNDKRNDSRDRNGFPRN
jgi:hypothetical protein